MARMLLLSILLVTTHSSLTNAHKNTSRMAYKPYGPKMCREICNSSKYLYVYNKEHLSCRILTYSVSGGNLSRDHRLMCLQHNPQMVLNDSKLIPEYHSCDDYNIGETSSNLQGLDLHHNYTAALHTACKEGNLCLVQHIISQGLTDINCQGKKGRTPVMTAAFHGQTAVFDYLVAEGCDLTATDDSNDTVLHTACKGGNLDVVRQLVVDMKHDVDSRGWRRYTPVMYASFIGRVKIFDFLRSHGCNITLTTVYNKNLLHLASAGGNIGMVKHILKAKLISIESKDGNGRTPVLVASGRGHFPVFDFLVGEHCNVTAIDYHGNNVLHVASLTGKVDMVKYIVEHSLVDINSRGHIARTAVMMAANKGRREVVDMLIRKNCTIAETDNNGDNMLHLVCSKGFIHMVEYILDLKIIDIERQGYRGRTAVMIAANNGHIRIVQLLVRRKCVLNATDDDDCNILHLACISGSVSVVRYLLSLNVVSVNSRGYYGRTPVMIAALKHYIGVMSVLVNAKCDLKITDDTGDTIFHLLCLTGNVTVVKYILELDVLDVDIRGQYERTAAMLAAQRGHMEVVKLLVSRNCDLEAVDTFGNSILHTACMGGHTDIVRYIVSCDPGLRQVQNKHDQTPAKLAEKMGHFIIAKLLKSKKDL